MTHKYFHHDDFEITDKLTHINETEIVEFTKKTRSNGTYRMDDPFLCDIRRSWNLSLEINISKADIVQFRQNSR
jgi:hypothetical protein